MKKYRVIYDFVDLTDEAKTIYHTGDSFPRKGIEVDADRIRELSTNSNKIGQPLIVEDGEVEESKVEETPVEDVKGDGPIEETPVEKKVEKSTRGRKPKE